MSTTAEIPFEEMCHHARCSLLVNGLRPKEWRFGHEVLESIPYHISHYQDLPVYPMRANGVACVAETNYKGKIVWMNKSNL